MPKLHQILAVENGIRNQTQKDLTVAHHGLQKEAMLQGLFREYLPLKEDGEKLPPERTHLQARASDIIQETMEKLKKSYDLIATRDFANTQAKADVVVNDLVFIKDAPTPFLLWLEDRLEDIHTFVTKLPTLPADTEWDWDENQNCYRNRHEIKTARTNKIAYPLVLLEPTKEHPGQAVEKSRDEIVGYWTTHKYSGALPVKEVKEMKERVEELQKAVKFAREKANDIEVTEKKFAETVLKYIFGNGKK